MGNRSSSDGKQRSNGVDGKRRTSGDEKRSSGGNNDKNTTRTKADEIVDPRPSLNLTMYRSLSHSNNQVLILMFL